MLTLKLKGLFLLVVAAAFAFLAFVFNEVEHLLLSFVALTVLFLILGWDFLDQHHYEQEKRRLERGPFTSANKGRDGTQ